MQKIWKDIDGYEGLYQISNQGEVKSLERFYSQWRGGKTLVNEKILKGWLCNSGYLQVRFSVEGKSKIFLVHRLVASHFIDNHENKKTVNHKDLNKLNNNVDNLEWATQQQNIIHSHINGRSKTGCERNQARLSEKDIFEIRKMYIKKKFGYVKVAKKFNVSPRVIFNIIKNKTYKKNGHLEL